MPSCIFTEEDYSLDTASAVLRVKDQSVHVLAKTAEKWRGSVCFKAIPSEQTGISHQGGAQRERIVLKTDMTQGFNRAATARLC